AKIGLSAAVASCPAGAKKDAAGAAAGIGNETGGGARGGDGGGARNAPPADIPMSGCFASFVALLSWLIQMNARKTASSRPATPIFRMGVRCRPGAPETADPSSSIPFEEAWLLVTLIAGAP